MDPQCLFETFKSWLMWEGSNGKFTEKDGMENVSETGRQFSDEEITERELLSNAMIQAR